MDFKIEKVSERDMDLLVINEFIKGKLIDLFLNKSGINDCKIISIEHSLMDSDLGESDITVIVEKDGHKVGLLIEDKIDAIAMDLQPERYVSRGDKGVENHSYDDYKIFIIAPQEYLDSNSYAKKYQYQISYEEIRVVLKDDLYARSLIDKAIEEKRNGYNPIEDENVTEFWSRYYEFIKQYPQIRMNKVHGPRGSSAQWPELHTNYPQVKIIHKADRGYMDLTFNGTADYPEIFKKYVPDISVPTGKSLAVRMDVPILDFHKSFDDQIDNMKECMEAAIKLYDLLSRVDVVMMYNEINKIENSK